MSVVLAGGEDVPELVTEVESLVSEGKAEEALKKATGVLKGTEKSTATKAEAAQAAACVYLAKGKPLSAVKLVTEEIGKTSDKKEKAALYVAKASIMFKKSAFKDAETAAGEAAALFKELGSAEDQAAALFLVVKAQVAAGKVEDALTPALSALTATTGNKKLMPVYQDVVAQVQVKMGKGKEAMAQATAAMTSLKEAEAWKKYGDALLTVMEAHTAQDNPEEALALGKQELLGFREAKNKNGMAATHKALSKMCAKMGNLEGAANEATRAVGRLKEIGNKEATAEGLKYLAKLQLQRGNNELCLIAAKDAIKLLDGKGGSNVEMAELWKLMADGYASKGEEMPSSARRDQAKKSLESFKSALVARSIVKLEAAYKQLLGVGAFGSSELDKILADVSKNDKDPEGAKEFFYKVVPLKEAAITDVAEAVPFTDLRLFPASPPSGQTDKGLDWSQSMGRITFTYFLEGTSAYTKADFQVLASYYQMQVSVGGKKLDALTGELFLHIYVGKSWWDLVEENGVQSLVICLAKRENKSWEDAWYVGKPINRNKVKRFPWQQVMQWAILDYEAYLGPEKELGLVPFGKPTALETVCRPDDIVIGLEALQDKRSVTVNVHFDTDAYDGIKEMMPVEGVFSADVAQTWLNVWITGDEENPIFQAQWGGKIDVETVEWSLCQTTTMKSAQKPLGIYSPALKIKALKATPGLWKSVICDVWQHRFAYKDPSNLASEERHDEFPGAKVYRRMGVDLTEDDYWEAVEEYVEKAMKNSGFLAPIEVGEVPDYLKMKDAKASTTDVPKAIM